MLCFLYQRREKKAGNTFTEKKVLRIRAIGTESMIGILIGAAVNLCVVATAVLSKSIAIGDFAGNVGVSILFLGSVVIQSFAEEYVFRGFLMEHLRNNYGIIVGIFGNSILFAVAHIFNPGMTFLTGINIFVVAIAFSLIRLRRENLIAVTWIHAVWNFMNEIVFGLPNSGIVCDSTLFITKIRKQTIWFHTIFGTEGGIGTLIVWGIIIILVLAIGKQSKRKN